MEHLRITEVPEENTVEIAGLSPKVFRQPISHDRVGGPLVMFRCCVCGENHMTFDEVGLGYLHIKDLVVCCVICEAAAQIGRPS